MLRLVGRMADGLLVSHNYVRPDRLPQVNHLVDEGARQSGRAPTAIRRGYNLMGVLSTGSARTAVPGLKDDYISGSIQEWVDQLLRWHADHRIDTFIFWPVAGDQPEQIEAFAEQVVPAVKAALALI